tara:strand:- start:303 stop:533 length:231 start_codon:yes stop_codon:yes gene_type:complete
MTEFEYVEWLFGLIAIGIIAVLAKVWKIPLIEQKLDAVVRETDKNRDKIHDINNTLHHHEYRISNLEKSKTERTES